MYCVYGEVRASDNRIQKTRSLEYILHCQFAGFVFDCGLLWTGQIIYLLLALYYYLLGLAIFYLLFGVYALYGGDGIILHRLAAFKYRYT